jgi:hypothetical protein
MKESTCEKKKKNRQKAQVDFMKLTKTEFYLMTYTENFICIIQSKYI